MTSVWVWLAAGVAGLVWVRQRLVVVTVTGTSMAPTYQAGERLLVRRTGIASVTVGQVVVLDRRCAEEEPVTGHPPRAPVRDGARGPGARPHAAPRLRRGRAADHSVMLAPAGLPWKPRARRGLW